MRLLDAIPILLTVLLLAGCGASATQIHMRAAYESRATVDDFARSVEQARSEEAVEVIEAAPDEASAEAAAREVQDDYAPLVDALNAAIEAADSWAQALLLAHAIDTDRSQILERSYTLAGDLLAALERAFAIAERKGKDPPDIPPILGKLIGGGS